MKAARTAPAILWFCMSAANAGPILDQAYDAKTDTGFIIGDRLNLAQTFTVGASGMLTGVAVEIRNFCNSISPCGEPQVPLVVDVRRTLNGKPVEANAGADILGSASLAWASSPFGGVLAWVDFDLPDFAVSSGELLALVLRAPGSGQAEPYVWASDSGLNFAPTPGTYSGGREFLRFAGGVWGDYPGQSSANGDFSFRTYVDSGPAIQAIPEPGSLGLAALGLMAGLACRRIR